MTSIRERLYNDINSFVSNPAQSSSPIAKALKDESITKEEYKELKQAYAGNDKNKQKEFDDAIASTLGDKVKSLNQSFDSGPVTVKFTRFDDKTIIADNDDDITNKDSHTVVKKDNSEESKLDKNDKLDILSTASNIIQKAKSGNFEEALNSVSKDIRPKSSEVANKINEKLKELAKNKAEELTTAKEFPSANILNFDEMKLAEQLMKSELLPDNLKVKLANKINDSKGTFTAVPNGGKFNISVLGNKFTTPITPFEYANPAQKGFAVPGANIKVGSGVISPLVGLSGSLGGKVEIADIKPIKNNPLKVGVEASVEGGRVAPNNDSLGFTTGVGLKFSLDD